MYSLWVDQSLYFLRRNLHFASSIWAWVKTLWWKSQRSLKIDHGYCIFGCSAAIWFWLIHNYHLTVVGIIITIILIVIIPILKIYSYPGVDRTWYFQEYHYSNLGRWLKHPYSIYFRMIYTYINIFIYPIIIWLFINMYIYLSIYLYIPLYIYIYICTYLIIYPQKIYSILLDSIPEFLPVTWLGLDRPKIYEFHYKTYMDPYSIFLIYQSSKNNIYIY